MTEKEIEQIRVEANRLLNKKYPMIHEAFRLSTLEFLFEAMKKLGWKVRKK